MGTSRTMMALTQVSLLLCVTYVAAFSSSFSPVTHRAPVVARSTGAFRHSPINMGAVAADEKVVVIGVAADSGCGKSTFMRRLTRTFGGDAQLLDIGRETNTLVSDTTTVICLDDYHKYDRTGRSENGITALHADCQLWDLMAEQVTSLKDKKSVDKPIYNHITGELDEPETIEPSKIMIFEGLHPFYDERVRDASERGHSIESIKAAIEGRKADFAEFVEPQKAQADVVIQVQPSDVVADETGKYLKVRLIQKNGVKGFKPTYLIDAGSEFTWVPDASKVASSMGLKLAYYQENFLGNDCSVLEMDGVFDDPEQLVVIESMLCNTGAEREGELTEMMAANKDAVGSDNGTGFLQAVCALKLREVYAELTK